MLKRMWRDIKKDAKAKVDSYFGIRPSWCPEGFAPCDGRVLSKSKYADLFKVLSNGFGESRVPDLAPEPDPYVSSLVVPVICTTGSIPGMIIYVAVKPDEYERTA